MLKFIAVINQCRKQVGESLKVQNLNIQGVDSNNLKDEENGWLLFFITIKYGKHKAKTG